MMHLDLQLTLADNDLRKVIQMCELAGVEAKFPFLHEGVVEFAACIPPELLIHRWRLRYFYKQAMRSFLPKQTIEKEKHGFALPFRIWMGRKGPLRDLVGDTLSQHNRRGIVNPAYLDSIIDEWDAEEARIYAPFVWSLTILELWLQKRGL
jgi:asparagine synthase (glutamine-hydrolysing)